MRNSTSRTQGTEVSVMPCCRSADTSASPIRVPMTIPISAPNVARITASDLIMARTCGRRMPTARSSPISRVRSSTDSMSVFTIPISAISTARASSA